MLHARVLVVTACNDAPMCYPCAGRTACNDAPMCYPCAAIHVERHGYTVTMKLHVEVSRLVSLGVGNVPSTRGSRYCTLKLKIVPSTTLNCFLPPLPRGFTL